jgi:hypothetical protein
MRRDSCQGSGRRGVGPVSRGLGGQGLFRRSKKTESDRGSMLRDTDRRRDHCSPWAGNRPHEMMRSIGSALDRSPDVTGHHGQEGADARRDRITHSAPARLGDLGLGTRRRRQHADALDPADRRGAVLRVRGLRAFGARDPQLDRTTAAGSAVGELDGVAAGRGASRALSSLWRADRTAALRGGQGPLHGAAGGRRGPGL